MAAPLIRKLYWSALHLMAQYYGLDWATDEDSAKDALSEYVAKLTDGRVSLEWHWGWVFIRKEGYEPYTVSFPVCKEAWENALYLVGEEV